MRPLPREPELAQLLVEAEAARAAAYAPYSRFHVGAALRAADGRIYRGVNVENAAYGVSLCAERNALGVAIADGAREFSALAVAGPEGAQTVPCGACRQALIEFGRTTRVLYTSDDTVVETTIDALLPQAFSAATGMAAAAAAAAAERR
jgi:cytidine deaminase